MSFYFNKILGSLLATSFLPYSCQFGCIPFGVMHNSQISGKGEGLSLGRRCRKLALSSLIYCPPYVPTLLPHPGEG